MTFTINSINAIQIQIPRKILKRMTVFNSLQNKLKNFVLLTIAFMVFKVNTRFMITILHTAWSFIFQIIWKKKKKDMIMFLLMFTINVERSWYSNTRHGCLLSDPKISQNIFFSVYGAKTWEILLFLRNECAQNR